jgi:hypothetical protein
MVLREEGNMAIKIFDTFTPFLHDLLYLMATCFRKVDLIILSRACVYPDHQFKLSTPLQPRSSLQAS